MCTLGKTDANTKGIGSTGSSMGMVGTGRTMGRSVGASGKKGNGLLGWMNQIFKISTDQGGMRRVSFALFIFTLNKFLNNQYEKK